MRLIDADALRKCFEVPHELKCGIQAGMDEYALKCIDEQPTVAAPRWHRVEEPPKEHGPFLCAAKHERNGQTHWSFEPCWYADGDLKDAVFDAEQDSGFYSWSAYQDRDMDISVDYWMPMPEPPKEDV